MSIFLYMRILLKNTKSSPSKDGGFHHEWSEEIQALFYIYFFEIQLITFVCLTYFDYPYALQIY